MIQNILFKSLFYTTVIMGIMSSFQVQAIELDEFDLIETALTAAEYRNEVNAWERNRLFKRLIKGIEELKDQLAQEQLDLLDACQDVAHASETAINARTAKLEAMVAAMQIQLNEVTSQLDEQLAIQARRSSLERNVADMVEQLDRFEDILYEMSQSDAYVRTQLKHLVAQFTDLVTLITEVSHE